jgi:hypothetical protein
LRIADYFSALAPANTDLRIYGFTDFVFPRNQNPPGRRNERTGPVFCDADYGFVIRILWTQCTDFADSVYGFYGFTLIRI